MSKGEIEIDDSLTFYDLGLCQEMVDACESAGWKYPTPIQSKSIPLALKRKDIFGMAQTGSGKTGAYVLPILHHLLEDKKSYYALVLSPTRELSLQIDSVFRSLGNSIGLRVCTITGGIDEKAQLSVLQKKPHIIVATTGRLVQMMKEHPTAFDFSLLKNLVLDEADQMLSDTFLEDIKFVLSKINPLRQTYMFSATMPDDLAPIAKLTLSNPEEVSLSSRNITAKTLSEYIVIAPNGRKETMLIHLLREYKDKTTIVFTASCKTAQIITKMLKTCGITSVLYHGQLEQRERQAALESFRNGKFRVLVSTNVAARGLDVPHVDAVINYDLPDHKEDYVHRVGRAGRAERVGLALTIITMNDAVELTRLELFLNKKLQKKVIDENSLNSLVEEVELAKRVGNEYYKELKKKQNKKNKEKNRQ